MSLASRQERFDFDSIRERVGNYDDQPTDADPSATEHQPASASLAAQH
jgi:hypothetical protein